MAANTDGDNFGYTILWKIENISYSCVKKTEQIPRFCFTLNSLEGTKWSLLLFPMGIYKENYIDGALLREHDCSGPGVIKVDWHLSILDKDGSIFNRGFKRTIDFRKGVLSNYHQYMERKIVFETEKEALLPDDTLTLRYTMWKTGTRPAIKCLHLRSVLNVNKRPFLWRILSFSTLEAPVTNQLKDDLIECHLCLVETQDHLINLSLHIISFDEKLKYFSFKISFRDSKGQTEECGFIEYTNDAIQLGEFVFPLFSKMLMDNKSRYLHKDELLLDCEYAYADGTVLHEFDEGGITCPTITKRVDEKDTPQKVSVMANDLKSLYCEGTFSDVEIRTSTKTFSAHKNILSARSPVFKRMFNNNMKEKNSGHVDITDLEDDTIHRMLLYIYTESVEDLQFENACQLYTAADKYEIVSLRDKCSSFVKDNLTPTNVCDILILADLHQDSDLTDAVQHYILLNEKKVFGSEEWQKFTDIHSKLAAKIMNASQSNLCLSCGKDCSSFCFTSP